MNIMTITISQCSKDNSRTIQALADNPLFPRSYNVEFSIDIIHVIKFYELVLMSSNLGLSKIVQNCPPTLRLCPQISS